MLSRFDIHEFNDYILFLLEEIKEEDMYELYLYKTIISGMSYKEFKDLLLNSVDKEVTKKMSNEEEKNNIAKAEKILGKRG